MEPGELLFTDKDGTPSQLQEVIYDGLDRDYSDRYPALLRLMREGAPDRRLYACVMLASWGVPEGMEMLIEWARDPHATPWAGEPVTYDRHFGADAAFEMLADAVRVAGDVEGGSRLAELRLQAIQALLGIYDRVYFARVPALVLELDTEAAGLVADDIGAAVDNAVVASQSAETAFDMPTQAAFLLGPLAVLDDEHAARAAETLLGAHPDRSRTVREVAYALREGKGPATRTVLERLAASPLESVRNEALDSLARRGTL